VKPRADGASKALLAASDRVRGSCARRGATSGGLGIHAATFALVTPGNRRPRLTQLVPRFAPTSPKTLGAGSGTKILRGKGCGSMAPNAGGGARASKGRRGRFYSAKEVNHRHPVSGPFVPPHQQPTARIRFTSDDAINILEWLPR